MPEVTDGLVNISLNQTWSNGSTSEFVTAPLVADAFITTWITDDGEITIPANLGTHDYDVYWENAADAMENGTLLNQSGDATITGLTNGATYRVEITGYSQAFILTIQVTKIK